MCNFCKLSIIENINKFLSPKNLLIICLFLCVISVCCYVLFFIDINRDTANVYAYYAREFGNGNFKDAILTKVPMLNILLGGGLSYLGMDSLKALCLVAGLFFLASVFPLYYLLKRYVSPVMAAYGCLLYITVPRLIKNYNAPLLESGRAFFLLAAILYFFKTLEEQKIKNAILLGLSVGLLATARGEGLIITFLLLFVYLIYALIIKKIGSIKKHILLLLIAIVSTFVALSPFCALNYAKSGYFVTDARIVENIKSIHKRIVKTDKNKQVESEKKFINYYTLPEEKYTLSHMISSCIKGGYLPYWIFAIIGLVLIIKEKRWNKDYFLLFTIAVIQNIVYFITITSSRYFLYMIPLFMIFTITGVDFLRTLTEKYVQKKFCNYIIYLCLIVLVFEFCYGLKSAFSRNEIKYKKVGEWIETYNKKHFPNRRLILFAPMMSEVAYWSKAINTERYENPRHNPKDFKDFDLAVVSAKRHYNMKTRNDLELIPNTPHCKSIWIFKVKKDK